MSAHVEFINVSKEFISSSGQQNQVLKNLNLSINKAEFVCLLGPSGCGKSSLLNLLAGFEQANSGQIVVKGNLVREPSPERAVVFQKPQLFPWLNVRQNIAFALTMRGANEQSYQAVVDYYMEQVGLKRFAEHAVWQLSGGMKQRVALARAWVQQSDVLLMDEPFAALDAQTRLLMQEMLVQLWQANKTTVLFITHDVDEALLLADRIVLMTGQPGQITQEINVDFSRPRRLEQLMADARYIALKQHILNVLRVEVARLMQLG